jgi:hypothetical protein
MNYFILMKREKYYNFVKNVWDEKMTINCLCDEKENCITKIKEIGTGKIFSLTINNFEITTDGIMFCFKKEEL